MLSINPYSMNDLTLFSDILYYNLYCYKVCVFLAYFAS